MKLRSVPAILLVACLAFVLAGCNAAGAKPPAGNQTSPVEAARDNAAPASDGTVKSTSAAPTNEYVAPSKYAYDDAEVNVDLTQMSGTAVYSAVYQMMVDPQSYQDQVVKMQGVFYSQYDEAINRRYYFIVVQDATACCAQGIEFVWDDGEHVYPDDYPAEGAEAVVCGRFGTYSERSAQFAYLNKASLALA
ncbi:MAG TPA: hypothetical protein DCP91_01500 [Eggerthellaceae bacterium]|nr:hypothetical protein [Eggerthellaceae bacterium]